MERNPEDVDSKFRYVLVAAKRAEQLMHGARAKTDETSKPTVQAMHEVTTGLVEWEYGPAPEPEGEELALDEELAADLEPDA